jgi:hypothetical protein
MMTSAFANAIAAVSPSDIHPESSGTSKINFWSLSDQ